MPKEPPPITSELPLLPHWLREAFRVGAGRKQRELPVYRPTERLGGYAEPTVTDRALVAAQYLVCGLGAVVVLGFLAMAVLG